MEAPNDPDPSAAERDARAHATLSLWLINVGLGVVIGTAYLNHLPEGLSLRGWIFVGFGLISSVATLALVPALLSWLSLRWWRNARAIGWTQALLGAAFVSMMKVDTVVYSLLRYHFFSSAVLNVAVTEGSEDAVHLGGRVWWPVAVAITLVTVTEYLLWRRFYHRRLEAEGEPKQRSWHARPVGVWGLFLLTIVGIEKSIYAAADLEGDREVPHAADVLPAYSHLRVSQLLPEGIAAPEAIGGDLELRSKGEPLLYPHAWPTVDPHGARPNVLLLVIDSWRQDSLSESVTPRLHAIAQEGRRFENHHAGGNGTRFGIFSMLYGLHGSYWFSALEERRSPVLLDVLQDEGYDLQVFSSASMNFPEFRDTAWVNCLEGVHDDYPAEPPFERDQQVAEHFGRFLGTRAELRADGLEPPPFFSFMLLDAAHQPYSAPPGGPFQPAAERLDYIELAQDRSDELVELVHNRYRNALHYVDRLAASVIDDLRDSGELENTILIITGDHGEEFQECGFWGHTSNFTPQQVDVPFVVFGPGVEPGVESRPTSHLDIAPTLLEHMGADPARRAGWCLGENLFDPPLERDLVVSGWGHVGLLAGDSIFRMRMGGRGASDVSVYDERWQPKPDAFERIQANEAGLRRMTEECQRFLIGDDSQ